MAKKVRMEEGEENGRSDGEDAAMSGASSEEESGGGGAAGRFDEEPDFSDPEDFVDDANDEELLPELVAARPKEADGVEAVIVVDGIPKVGADRLEKLKSVIKKIFSKYGKVVNEHYPLDDQGNTKGYMFLEFGAHGSAVEATKAINNYKLDKQHTFLVNMFSDFDKYLNIPDEWEPPTEEEYKDQGNLKSWLLDPRANDQFSVVHEGGEKVSIFTNCKPEPAAVEERPRWTDTYVRWSPLGTFLVTFHKMGIALWGGQDFHKVQKFGHLGVQYVDFSPCETYMVTFAPHQQRGGHHGGGGSDDPSAIVIWESRTGVKKRSFNADGPPVWPIFKWSSDGRFFARMSGPSTLSVYETPSFGLLDKKSIKVAGMRDFSWSPTENILAYWVAEDKDVPARVMLIEMPSRNEVRVKNLFNVAECKMHWQKTGDYLCVKVDRYNKLRKDAKDIHDKYAGIYYNFEIFHMREKQIPVDSVEIKENVHAFSWEPVGSKFAIIHGESQQLNVSFYGVKTGQTPTMLKKYERKSANHLFWSPSGQFVVLAGLRNMNGVLEFVDTADFTSMNSGEHFMCTDVEWDPTGRYLMTGVSWWGHKVDNAYWMWSFQGKILKRCQTERFCQFLWRPRPPTLLTKKQIQKIKKNLKTEYSPAFDAEDVIWTTKASEAEIQKRREMFSSFNEWRQRKQKEFADNKPARIAMRDGVDTDADAPHEENQDLEEEVVEFLVKEEEIAMD